MASARHVPTTEERKIQVESLKRNRQVHVGTEAKFRKRADSEDPLVSALNTKLADQALKHISHFDKLIEAAKAGRP